MFIFFLLLNCTKKKQEPQLHLISSSLIDTSIDTLNNENKIRIEYYIISNYESDKKKALSLISIFNQDLLCNKECIINNYDSYERFFYKESNNTPYNFTDNNSFLPDYIYDHNEDLICKIGFIKNKMPNGEVIIKWEKIAVVNNKASREHRFCKIAGLRHN